MGRKMEGGMVSEERAALGKEGVAVGDSLHWPTIIAIV
jgi:hypothetical protein